MCGIAGLVVTHGLDPSLLRQICQKMTTSLTHRGPDGDGVWVDSSARVSIGHRRLAIVDLSPTGHQPMVSHSERFVIAFNGEIYNHQELRSRLRLAGARFVGTSDTEVLLAGIELWGLEPTLRDATGMFAIALWDRKERQLILARDRLGEKPLYAWRNRRGLAFGSELRALLIDPGASVKVNRNALGLYLRYGYVPEPLSIIDGVHKVVPGTIEVWNVADGGLAEVPVVSRVWDLGDHQLDKFDTRESVASAVELRLRNVIEAQRVADVPVGAFLSGGVDSTLVTAVMQSLSADKVHTFCAKFDVPAYDESPYARRIAEYLGTEHTEIAVRSKDLLDIVYDLPKVYDEPLADSSQIPTIAVSRKARDFVTVCLSGDGGDELFGGYNRYYFPAKIYDVVSGVPLWLRGAASWGLKGIADYSPDFVLRLLEQGVLGYGPVQDLRGKLGRAAATLVCPSLDEAYIRVVTRWRDPSDVLSTWDDCDSRPIQLQHLMKSKSRLPAMTEWDILNYLPADNLVKVDRASMSVGLEMRAPLLDHRLVEISRSIVCNFSEESFASSPKWPLRDVLEKYVPIELWSRPKMGFSVPLADWLRRDLCGWCEDTINAWDDRGDDSLNMDVIRGLVLEHRRGGTDNANALWPLLTFMQWAAALDVRL